MESVESSLVIEAEKAIKECSFAVEYIEISNFPPATSGCVYFNMRTKENQCFCVKLTASGFKVVGKSYDEKTYCESPTYETLGSLLGQVSPMYRQLFGHSLIEKLAKLKQDQEPD